MAKATRTPPSSPGRPEPALTRHWGLGWIQAGGRSLAALRGLQHPQAQPTPAPPLPAHPQGRGPSSLSPSLPSLGAPSHPTGSGLSPCPLLREPWLPSRHSVPSTWRGALAQPAARGDRRPQLGSCSLPGRRGQAPAAVGLNGCSVSRGIPWLHPGSLPKEPGQCPACPANGSGGAAGGLGLKPSPVPGFLGLLWHLGHSAVPLLSLLHLPGIQGSGAAPGCHRRRWMWSWGPWRGQVRARGARSGQAGTMTRWRAGGELPAAKVSSGRQGRQRRRRRTHVAPGWDKGEVSCPRRCRRR